MKLIARGRSSMNWEERCMEEILLGFLSFNHKDTLRDSAVPDQNIKKHEIASACRANGKSKHDSEIKSQVASKFPPFLYSVQKNCT